MPTRLRDLVIYELHIGSLGFDHAGPGNLGDALDLIDFLDDLGVNAVELLPMSEFSGSWPGATATLTTSPSSPARAAATSSSTSSASAIGAASP